MTQIAQEWAHLVIRRSHKTAQCPRGVSPDETAFSPLSVSVSPDTLSWETTVSDRPGAAAGWRVMSETFSGLSESCQTGQNLFFFLIPSPEPPRAATISSTHSQKEMDYNRLFSFKQGPGALQPLHPLDVCTDGFEASTEDLSFCLHEIWFDWRTKPSSGRF